MDAIEFFVPGIPRPQGSKRAHVTKNRKVCMFEQSRYVKGWRDAIAIVAHNAAVSAGRNIRDACDQYQVDMVFAFVRPKSHLTSSGTLKSSKPQFPNGKPDADKLARALLDGITGILISDDSQVVFGKIAKVYTRGTPGVYVSVRSADIMAEWIKTLVSRLHGLGEEKPTSQKFPVLAAM